jgi:Domain of Unknown Function (DUF1259)
MKTFRCFLVSFTLLATLCGVAISAETASLNTAQIEQLTGLRGSLNEKEGVFKVTVPRSDVPISVDGWRMPPFMGLTSWVDDAPSKPNVLKQAGEAAFPVCIKEDTNITDGFVEMKFKPAAGKEDQEGGVIWRCKDKDNYYIARANALEDNVAIYHTIKGQRWLLRA